MDSVRVGAGVLVGDCYFSVMARKKVDIEACFSQLEDVIGELEAGDLPLEKALQSYEKGLQQLAAARQQLDAYAKRVTELDALLDPVTESEDESGDDDV